MDSTKDGEINTKFSNYLADDNNGTNKHREPTYCKELGFAMERIKEGYTLSDLWDVIPSS